MFYTKWWTTKSIFYHSVTFIGKTNQNPSDARVFDMTQSHGTSVTRLGDLLDFGQLFEVFGNN